MEGLNAVCSRKATDPERFFPLGLQRSGLGTFGVGYPSRAAARRALARRGLGAKKFSASFPELNSALNRYEAVLTCNMPGRMRRCGPLLNWLYPGLGIRGLEIAPDVMGKSFEIAASGAVLVVDWTPEFDQLGFIHGKHALFYNDLSEIPRLWKTWRFNHAALAEIGQAGSDLVREQHTWDERVREIEDIIRAEVK